MSPITKKLLCSHKKRRRATLTTAAGDAAVDDLPPEIWIEILIKLPAKSILRSKSVCKSWYSLVSCPDFISDYSIRNLNKNGNRVVLGLYDKSADVISYSSHNESCPESNEHNYIPEQFLRQASDNNIVGSCNGLICLSKHDRIRNNKTAEDVRTFLIWNPTIRKIVELPSLNFKLGHALRCNYLGFGFHSKTNGYKILCIVRKAFFEHDNYCEKTVICKIFDTRNSVWRGISPLIHTWNVNGHHQECYLNEAVHWSGYKRVGRSFDRIILSFDMGDECFRQIKMPDGTEFNGEEDGVETIIRSVALGGLLSVVVWKRRNESPLDIFESCSVWTMKRYGVTESWTKMSNIDRESARLTPSSRFLSDTFHVCENGEVLMVQRPLVEDDERVGHISQRDLVLYDMKSRKCKHLYSTSKSISGMCVYEESLVLM